jgi:hypothetical protein
MQRLDITGDAQRALDTLQNGGVVLIPHACGYGLFGGTEESTNRIFSTKQRAGHKRNTMLCDMETQREVHDVDRRAQEMIEAIAVDYDLPLCAVAPYRTDHPLLKNLTADMLKGSNRERDNQPVLQCGYFSSRTLQACSRGQSNHAWVFGQPNRDRAKIPSERCAAPSSRDRRPSYRLRIVPIPYLQALSHDHQFRETGSSPHGRVL